MNEKPAPQQPSGWCPVCRKQVVAGTRCEPIGSDIIVYHRAVMAPIQPWGHRINSNDPRKDLPG